MKWLERFQSPKKVSMPQSRVEREDPNTIVERHIVAHGQGAEMSHEKLDDFLESLNGHHVKLFVAMVAEMGGAFTQIIPLTGDGLVDERATKQGMMQEDEMFRNRGGDLAGRSLVQFLSHVVPGWHTRKGLFSVAELKKAADYIHEHYPSMHFHFDIDDNAHSLSCTTSIEKGTDVANQKVITG